MYNDQMFEEEIDSEDNFLPEFENTYDFDKYYSLNTDNLDNNNSDIDDDNLDVNNLSKDDNLNENNNNLT
ncbi:19452_t:CDS:1, partial [Dentiscutata erythropus]